MNHRELKPLTVVWTAFLLVVVLVAMVPWLVGEMGLADWWYGQDLYTDHAHLPTPTPTPEFRVYLPLILRNW